MGKSHEQEVSTQRSPLISLCASPPSNERAMIVPRPAVFPLVHDHHHIELEKSEIFEGYLLGADMDEIIAVWVARGNTGSDSKASCLYSS